MTTINLSPDAESATKQILGRISTWCCQNPIPVGVAQIAAGAAVIALGLKLGAIEIGRDFVATQLSPSASNGATGALIGAPLGAWAGIILGGIGVAAGGSAVGVPAVLVAGGAAAVFAMTGYTIGDLAGTVFSPSIDAIDLLASGSLLSVGIYLMVKGASKVASEARTLHVAGKPCSSIKDYTITLARGLVAVVASTKAEWRQIQAELLSPPETIKDAAREIGAATALGAAGAISGGAIAASSVSLLGSSTLGAAALSVGIVSAPLWPAVVGAVAFGGLGISAARMLKYMANRRQR
ncbi:hypothetical protein [Pseudomonas putida]|uniref:Uncharacterized protein n=1 Tax=Pseudomonas putida TaxID=303 RepID=A0A8I1JM37_PSEPU|nr:hypothetical protein [Pseudomonas putida]MBI6885085.1 hypothetical protein [Pseudomonas putida]